MALLFSGVGAADVALYAAYEVGFVVLPGVLLVRALGVRVGGWGGQVCIGWALGYVLEIAAFAGTAALGARWLFLLYPPLVVAGVALHARRAGNSSVGTADAERAASGPGWAAAVVAMLAIGFLAADSFSQLTLPSSLGSAHYYPDVVWYWAVAGEALHHWPIADPTVAGSSLSYHVFVSLHMAAAAQVTGIELGVIALRLQPLTMLLVVVLGLVFAGRHFSRQVWGGPVAAALVLFVWRPDLDLGPPAETVGTILSQAHLSPTFVLGLALFLPATVLVEQALSSGREERAPIGVWISLALLLVGCSGAKASILPLMLGGLSTAVAYILVAKRRLDRGALAAFGLVAFVLAASYLLLYAGRSSGFELSAFQLAGEALPRSIVGVDVADEVYWPLAVLASFALLAPVVGAAWALRSGWRQVAPGDAWMLGMLFPALVLYYGLGHDGDSQTYFLLYGWVAAAVVAAGGLVAVAQGALGGPRRRVHLLLVPGIAWLLACSIAVGALELAGAFGLGVPDGRAIAIAYGFAAAATFVAVGLAVWRRPVTGRLALAVVVAALAAGALDGAVDRGAELVERYRDPARAIHQVDDDVFPLGITGDLVEGFDWVRRSTPEGTVIAVNNQFLHGGGFDARYFYASALTERLVYLEGWDYSDGAFNAGWHEVRRGLQPYPGRFRLNSRAVRGDPAALRGLRRRGVTHLLIDKLHGGPRPGRRLARRVFSNDALDVYELQDPLGPVVSGRASSEVSISPSEGSGPTFSTKRRRVRRSSGSSSVTRTSP